MNQSVNTYAINTYQPTPSVMEVPVTEYQNVIESSIAKYGVKWIYNRKIVNNEEATTPVVKRLKREVDYLWYADYKCHRFIRGAESFGP